MDKYIVANWKMNNDFSDIPTFVKYVKKNAKKEKNYARADEIRAELTAMGVTLIDTAQGTQYKID